MHRLRAAGTEIDDGESALTQYHAAFSFDPDVTGIRPAMPHRLDHGFADRAQRVGRSRRVPVDHAGDAAHYTTPEDELRNWTCRSPASSSPTGFTVRHTAGHLRAGVPSTALHVPHAVQRVRNGGCCFPL